MGDLLQKGSDWLAGQLKTHASREVVYQREAQQVTVRAIIGRKDFEVETAEGKLYVRANDFLIHRVDLVFGGQATLPERGDRILVDFGQGTETFEVLPGDGTQPWEFSDPFETLLRIHTQKVS
jgi:hypothetical protein